VKKGKFLACLISTKGIEANPSKIEAILRTKLSKSRKGAQRLAGSLASFNKFISRSVERNLPFFENLADEGRYVGRSCSDVVMTNSELRDFQIELDEILVAR
jgi:hypothetical protein